MNRRATILKEQTFCQPDLLQDFIRTPPATRQAPLTQLCRSEQWYQSNPALECSPEYPVGGALQQNSDYPATNHRNQSHPIPYTSGHQQPMTCKSQCSLRSDSTGYGSYHQTSNYDMDPKANQVHQFGTLTSCSSSNGSPSSIYDQESLAYYSGGSASSDSSAISLDPKDPEASIDDFFRTPEFYDIESAQFTTCDTPSLRSDGTLDNSSGFKRRRQIVSTILDEVQPTPELHRKDMADMARNVLDMINNLKLETSSTDEASATTNFTIHDQDSEPCSSRSTGNNYNNNNNNNTTLESIPEEHIYEEINYDSPQLNLQGIQPPPLPKRNLHPKLVRFQSDPRLDHHETFAQTNSRQFSQPPRFYGLDKTVSSPSLRQLKRKLPSRHVFPNSKMDNQNQNQTSSFGHMNLNRCFSYDALPTQNLTDFECATIARGPMHRSFRPENTTIGYHKSQSFRDLNTNSNNNNQSVSMSPLGTLSTQFNHRYQIAPAPPSNATLKQWWLMRARAKQSATRV